MSDVPGWDERDRVLAPVVDRAPRAGVFLDVDGVLAPIMPRPDQTSVPRALAEAVARLVGSYGLVAVVSGRSAADAQRLVGLSDVLVVGNHGMESLRGGEHEWLVPDDVLERVRKAWSLLEANGALPEAGVRLEDKTASVALHTRGAEDEDHAWTQAVAAANRAAEANGLVALEGRRVVDLRPAGIDKGTAVEALVERHGLAAAVYVGDDRTDVDAFRALKRLRTKDGLIVANVAVVSDESPADLLEWGDLAIQFEDVGSLIDYLDSERERRSRR